MREEVAGTRSNNEIDVEKAAGKYRKTISQNDYGML